MTREQPPDAQRDSSPTGVRDPRGAARIFEHVETRGIRFVNLEFTDVVGLAKSVTIPAEQLGAVLARGKWFDGSSIEGYARVAETDMYLRPDLSTFAEVPWHAAATAGAQGDDRDGVGRVARLICDVLMPTGERFEGDPRAVLVAALDRAASLGYRYEVAPELEFFLLREGAEGGREPLPDDHGGYFDHSTDLASDVRREIVRELAAMGIAIESTHHEVAAGQHEIDLAPADALRCADALVTARYAIKAIARRHGLWATFMPKPFHGISGSGMHVHQRLLRAPDDADAFSAPDDPGYGLSAVGRQFVAGQLAHAPALTAVVAPLVNSYKRLVPGFEAPVMVSWGRVNREALVRVPRAGGERDVRADATRVELRSPDPSCNPYLALAAMLTAGLDGMANDLPLPAPVEEGLYTLDETARLRRGIRLLPASLAEALAALQADAVLLDALGEQVATWFLDAKSREWADYRTRVSPWEIERYLPVF